MTACGPADVAAVVAMVAALAGAPFLVRADLRSRRLPHRVVLPLLGLTALPPVLAAVCGDPPRSRHAVAVLETCAAVGLAGIALAFGGGWGMGDAKLALALELLVADRGVWRLALLGIGTAAGALLYLAIAARTRPAVSATPGHAAERAPPERPGRTNLPCGPWLLCGAALALAVPG